METANIFSFNVRIPTFEAFLLCQQVIMWLLSFMRMQWLAIADKDTLEEFIHHCCRKLALKIKEGTQNGPISVSFTSAPDKINRLLSRCNESLLDQTFKTFPKVTLEHLTDTCLLVKIPVKHCVCS